MMRVERVLLSLLVATSILAGCLRENPSHAEAPGRAITSGADRQGTLEDLRPPKRDHPIIAVLGDNAGTETTDFLVPYGVLVESGAADVIAVAPEAGPIDLMPALSVRPQQTLAAFDTRYPGGADYVVVPAMHVSDGERIIEWIRAQAKGGALIVGICSGALVLAEAGLLDGREATTHWFDRAALARKHPNVRLVEDRRYVIDRGVVTTTGVSASVPVSLALVEAIGGRALAADLARRLGADPDWGDAHDSSRFRLDFRSIARAAGNRLAFWGHERLALPVGPGVDEISLALTADAYSRTYRSTVFALAESRVAVRTRRGLMLVPDATPETKGIDHRLALPRSNQPVRALSEALSQIRRRYGDATASLVRLGLEYPPRGDNEPAVDAPVRPADP